MKFNVNADLIKREIDKLDTFKLADTYGTTRVLFTKPELDARQYIKDLMTEAGLTVTEDSIGNIFGSLVGSCPEEPPVWSGSHIDTVLNAGKYDGMAGVISAIEALRSIKASGAEHKRTIQAIVFTSEEPTRFGLSCLGSRAMTGRLTLDETKKLFDDDGNSLYDVLESLKYNLSEFSKIKRNKGDVYASVELHIEQSEHLEKAGCTIGIVDGICAASYINVKVHGVQEHAGSTSMEIRHDALCAAAEMVIELEKTANEMNEKSTVATVGKLNVYPNSANVISGLTEFTIDIRSIEMSLKDEIIRRMKKAADDIEKKRGVKIDFEITVHDKPAKSESRITQKIEKYAQEQGYSSMHLISGAYHDSLEIASFVPMAMIFVPSVNGISHHKDEFTKNEDIHAGAEVLASVLYELSNE